MSECEVRRKGVREESGVRRLGTILAFGTLACACLFGQTKTTVRGMSRFTDAGFGFSFCYPSAWKVLDEPVADPTRNGWFPDAKIVKQLAIRNPAAWDNEDQLGVMIQELLAPRGLTELGRFKSPSPVGVDRKIFYDSGTRRWMFEKLTELPDGTPPATSPAEIRLRTIGGLPIFWGETRGGAEVIVPLDGSHFLAISSLVDPGNINSHTYLAATVVATAPGAGQRASEQAQAEAIRREGIKLGAIGELLGGWYKDGQHVYDFQGEVIPGADPKTFTPLSHNGMIVFARDGIRVYDSDGAVIPGADPKTFVATGMSTARDAHHTYDWSSGSLKISNVSPHE
jgi:hypothetical protein